MIECYDIIKQYGKDCKALDGISEDIKDGEFLAIIGESGSGKSTFLNILGMIDTKDSGAIMFDGINYDDLSKKEAAQFRNQKLGYIFQNFYLEPEYTVYKNVEIPLLIAGYSEKQRKVMIENTLKKVQMKHKINQLAKNLSGGEKQRVCIARALVNEPEVILADEPCGNLDSQNTQNILQILKQLNKEGKTIIMVTHSKSDAAIADRCITFKDGKIMNEKTV
ncbi:MAG: ABC transporter ATP-binding protein [Lachnospiraceae bacterium]|nr:ABC transporter ATP-binding protein [Lachnospiraceae bacterium]